MRCLICKLYDNAADVFQYVCKLQMMGLNKQVLYCVCSMDVYRFFDLSKAVFLMF